MRKPDLTLALPQTVQKTPNKNEAADLENPTKSNDAPLPLKALLTRPILMSVACYALLALLDISFRAMQPLFYATPIEFGGLGQSPAWIGSMMSLFGIMNGVVQAFLFPVLIERWGPKRVYVSGMAMFAVLFTIFPIINAVARTSGISILVYGLVIGQLALSIVCDMSYGMYSVFSIFSIGLTSCVQLPSSCMSQQRHPTKDRLAARTALHRFLPLSCAPLVPRCLHRCSQRPQSSAG